MSILDELVPLPLTSLTPEALDRLRGEGKQEGLYFELKEKWPGTGVSKAVCAFANGYGGFLIVGASQHSDGTIDRYPGLNAAEEWPLRVKDMIVGHISPLPVWDAASIPSPDDDSMRVLVVRVEGSDQTPHVLTSTGQVYQRTGSSSDPVRDKATIDQLIARGAGGRARLLERVEELLLTPGVRRYQDPEFWRIEIASIPTPPMGVAYGNILTSAGYRSAGEGFPGVGGAAPYAARPLEDGVILRSGTVDLARYTDGSVYARFPVREVDYVVTSWPGKLLLEVLSGQAKFMPPVRQVFVWIRLGGIGGRTVAVNLADARSEGTFSTGMWGPLMLTLPTTGEEPKKLAGQIGRRLWRAVGEEVFED